jgi:uncharacterized RDD family membrane protein YckC
MIKGARLMYFPYTCDFLHFEEPLKISFYIRSIAFIIDIIILNFIFLTLLVASLSANSLTNKILELDFYFNQLIFILISGYFFNLIVCACYFCIFHTIYGQTPGKMLLGIKVINKNGENPDFLISFLRWLGYFISTIFFFLGFLWAIWDKDHQTWHDKICNTYVVTT